MVHIILYTLLGIGLILISWKLIDVLKKTKSKIKKQVLANVEHFINMLIMVTVVELLVLATLGLAITGLFLGKF